MDRDTKFSGFAKLLWREMLDLKGYIDESDSWIYGDNESPEYEQIIAQRAYDLVAHTLKHTPMAQDWTETDWIPDLTQWPESPTSRLLDRST
jgi:hypothetical protein